MTTTGRWLGENKPLEKRHDKISAGLIQLIAPVDHLPQITSR